MNCTHLGIKSLILAFLFFSARLHGWQYLPEGTDEERHKLIGQSPVNEDTLMGSLGYFTRNHGNLPPLPEPGSEEDTKLRTTMRDIGLIIECVIDHMRAGEEGPMVPDELEKKYA